MNPISNSNLANAYDSCTAKLLYSSLLNVCVSISLTIHPYRFIRFNSIHECEFERTKKEEEEEGKQQLHKKKLSGKQLATHAHNI